MSSIQNVADITTKRRIRGQGMTEYIIVVALIAIGCVGAVSVFGEAVQAQFANMSNALMGDTANATITVDTAAKKTLKDFGGTAAE